ncbi:uncharacterized protein KY384_002770 [Bacidia gigantensis]|uniref:uncharacterized protein n=1 Tax=Bacidia gigantensis TaxID=2732470 RepID=UPI001D03A98F|nr:uncharacterized protein KY384_002770 [Bacidia gigantensis]KAG8532892.1 hypothetical protein KY384_002770 [Bacidia gigantensis]
MSALRDRTHSRNGSTKESQAGNASLTSTYQAWTMSDYDSYHQESITCHKTDLITLEKPFDNDPNMGPPYPQEIPSFAELLDIETHINPAEHGQHQGQTHNKGRKQKPDCSNHEARDTPKRQTKARKQKGNDQNQPESANTTAHYIADTGCHQTGTSQQRNKSAITHISADWYIDGSNELQVGRDKTMIEESFNTSENTADFTLY